MKLTKEIEKINKEKDNLNDINEELLSNSNFNSRNNILKRKEHSDKLLNNYSIKKDHKVYKSKYSLGPISATSPY